jgi:hypothetical protein
MHILSAVWLVLTHIGPAIALIVGVAVWVIGQLRRRAVEQARAVNSASVIRGAAIPLRWHERLAVWVCKFTGRGNLRGIQGGEIRTMVDVTPDGFLLAAAARDRFAPKRQPWDDDYYQ